MGKKHVLIVGGTRGIGRALVRVMSEEGFIVSVIGKRPLQKQDKNILNVSYWQADITDEKKLFKTLAEVVSRNGRLNSLVFFQRYRGDGDRWQGEIKTSLTATKKIIEYFTDKFGHKEEGSIVIVSSVASFFVAGEQPLSYHVVKAGLNQMVRYYAFVLGAKEIRVNAVSPGTVLKDESRSFYLKNKQLYNLYKTIIPLGRMGTSTDIAQVIAFLCSKKAAFITGQNIIVDGGMSLHWQESLARELTPLKGIRVTRQIHREEE